VAATVAGSQSRSSKPGFEMASPAAVTWESRCKRQAPPERPCAGAGRGTQAAVAPDFEFAQDVAAGRFGLVHQDAQVAGFDGARQLEVVAGGAGYGRERCQTLASSEIWMAPSEARRNQKS